MDPEDVNNYLKGFDITAKDIRGFRANDEMCKALRAERSKGPKELPRDRKEKDKILKAEFKDALECVAEIVGHEPTTLRSQYLVPSLEDTYVHDGTVIKDLTGKTATRTPSEKEDDAIEKMVQPSPKKKPPRKDLQKHRIQEDDPDLDTKDPDLSMSETKVAMAVRIAWAVLAEDLAEGGFQTWVQSKEFRHPQTGNLVHFKSLPEKLQEKIRRDWAKKPAAGSDKPKSKQQEEGQKEKPSTSKDTGEDIPGPDDPVWKEKIKDEDKLKEELKKPSVTKKSPDATKSQSEKKEYSPGDKARVNSEFSSVSRGGPSLSVKKSDYLAKLLNSAVGKDEFEFKDQVAKATKKALDDVSSKTSKALADKNYHSAVSNLRMLSEDGEDYPFDEKSSEEIIRSLASEKKDLYQDIHEVEVRAERAKKREKTLKDRYDSALLTKETGRDLDIKDEWDDAKEELKEAEAEQVKSKEARKKLDEINDELLTRVSTHHANVSAMSAIADPDSDVKTNAKNPVDEKVRKDYLNKYKALPEDYQKYRMESSKKSLKALGRKDPDKTEDSKITKLRDHYEADIHAGELAKTLQEGDEKEKRSRGEKAENTKVLESNLVRAINKSSPGSKHLTILNEGVTHPDYRKTVQTAATQLSDDDFIKTFESHVPDRAKQLLETLKGGTFKNPFKDDKEEVLGQDQAAYLRKSIINAVLNDAGAEGSVADEGPLVNPDLKDPKSKSNEKPKSRVQPVSKSKIFEFLSKIKDKGKSLLDTVKTKSQQSVGDIVKPTPMRSQLASSNRIASIWLKAHPYTSQ